MATRLLIASLLLLLLGCATSASMQGCRLEQVLAMKDAGMSDDEVRNLCAEE